MSSPKVTANGLTKTLAEWLHDLRINPIRFWKLHKRLGSKSVAQTLNRITGQ